MSMTYVCPAHWENGATMRHWCLFQHGFGFKCIWDMGGMHDWGLRVCTNVTLYVRGVMSEYNHSARRREDVLFWTKKNVCGSHLSSYTSSLTFKLLRSNIATDWDVMKTFDRRQNVKGRMLWAQIWTSESGPSGVIPVLSLSLSHIDLYMNMIRLNGVFQKDFRVFQEQYRETLRSIIQYYVGFYNEILLFIAGRNLPPND